MRIIDKLKNATRAALAAGFAMTATGAAAQEIKVGGKDFTEQFLLAEMTTQLLQKNGFTVSKRDGMGTNIVRAALENGEVDVY